MTKATKSTETKKQNGKTKKSRVRQTKQPDISTSSVKPKCADDDRNRDEDHLDDDVSNQIHLFYITLFFLRATYPGQVSRGLHISRAVGKVFTVIVTVVAN